MAEKTMLEWALYYLKKGFSVIPIARGSKQPNLLRSWKKYQTQLPTEKDVKNWWTRYPDANIGIITGAISGIAVVDFDNEEAVEFAKKHHFPLTPLVKTGRGYHAYYKYKEGVRNFQKRDDLPGIDLKGEGGCVVAPPSVHPSGALYKWVSGKGLDDLSLSELPDIIFTKNRSEKTPLKELYRGTEEGSRNDTLARLTGSWVNDGLTFDECLENAFIWNSKNNPPLQEREVITTVRSIYEKHYREKERILNDKSSAVNNKTNKTITVDQLVSEGKIKFGIGDLLDTSPEPINWLIEDLVVEKAIAIIDGIGASGKSILMLQLAMSVASGTPFLGRFKTEQKKVLYLNAEDPINILHHRVKKISYHIPEIDLKRENLTIVSMDVFDAIPFFTEKLYGSIKHTQMYENVKALCQYWGPELIIIDPLSYFLHDENSSDSAIAFYYLIRQLNATIIAVHHQSKAAMNGAMVQRAKARGSSVLVENVRTRMSLEKGQLIIDKNNYGKQMIINLVMQDGYWILNNISDYTDNRKINKENKKWG